MNSPFKSFTAGRVVTLLTPLLFVPLAAYITLQAAKLGLELPRDETLTFLVEAAIYSLGALTAWLKSRAWLKNYAAWEVAEAQALAPAALVTNADTVNVTATVPETELVDPEADAEEVEYEREQNSL